MIRDADVLSLLMSRQPNYSLDRPFYLDPDLYNIDLRTIWYRDWILAATTPELPKTGSYLTVQLGEYSVIVVKGADGKIRAFHNSCRHRGSRICTADKGTAPKLVCPYHQWTYDLDGKLLWAREMGEDFSAQDHGLRAVHCCEIQGMIYVCLAETAADMAPLEAQAARYLAPHDPANLNSSIRISLDQLLSLGVIRRRIAKRIVDLATKTGHGPVDRLPHQVADGNDSRVRVSSL